MTDHNNERIQYDPSGVFLEETGISPSDLAALAPKLEAARKEMLDVDAPLFEAGGPLSDWIPLNIER